jgi:hypothetical protein
VWRWLRATFGQALAEMKDPNNNTKDDSLADRDTNYINCEFLSLFLWVEERVGYGERLMHVQQREPTLDSDLL